ncbi:MAG: 2-hydroxychromene-2-carboxylate isomerase [Hyphomicrobiales bacterium]|nr:2-hydroxychromene-2-carboxylate isomerase [Hyphomicrobiales bacterium]
MTTIDYFFTLVSPFVHLGHRAFLDVARKHGAEVRFRPVALMGVWEHSGAVPLSERPQSRQDYRLIELQRWREKRGVALNLHPEHFPTNPTLADRSVIALVEAGADPADYAGAVLRACWADDRDIADAGVLTELLEQAGHDAGATLKAAQSDAVAAIHQANTDAAVALGIVGAPGYALNGEPFWGQDRIELLADALASARAPYEVA